jgi:hypothetical protein
MSRKSVPNGLKKEENIVSLLFHFLWDISPKSEETSTLGEGETELEKEIPK